MTEADTRLAVLQRSVFEYPSKNAFYEEMTWMLWQAATART